MNAQLASCSGNDIGGTVFREFAADGIQNAGELGIEGITVNAYNGSGLAATTTTLSDGSYSLNSLVAGVTYRIEFVWTETYLEPSPVGANSNTSVQFILAGNCNNDFGLHNPGDFCEDNPRLYTACYQDHTYNGANAGKDALVSWEYNEGGGNNPTTKMIEASHSQVGSVYGLAYHRTSKNLLWSAFMKRHVGFGPSGIGAIYTKDVPTGNITTWADLETILGAGTLGADPHPAGPLLDCDPDSWDPVGKRSFGDLEISDDQSALYTINLSTRELYKIDITDFPATPVAGDFTTTSIPLLSTASGAHVAGTSDPAPSTNMRPFGLGFHDGLLYVGVVYSAESSQSAADMYAYVYSFDPATNTFNTTPVISFPLNYPRGCAVNLCSTYGGDADWNPWVTTWTVNNTRFGNEKVYPQPWISDIEFTDDGYMILGLRDRFGDQTGYRQKSTSCSGLYHGDVAGDLLMASPNAGNTWTLESGGNVGTKSASSSQGSTQGPGNGEFFWRDYFFDSYFNQVLHEETSLGAIVVVPGKNEVVSANYDVSRDFQGGINYYDTDDGSRNKFIQIFRSTSSANSTFGKGGGLGDIQAACQAAPIEIGNYVWNDADKDGIQDPDEIAFANVSVNLYYESTPGTYLLIGKATTDVNGNYVFNDSNVDMSGVSSINGNPNSGNYTGLNPFTTYYISINDATQFNTSNDLLSLSGKDYFLTNADANSNNSDKIDSDASLSATAGAAFFDYPTIVATIGGSGQNDHSFDFGFFEAGCDVLVGLASTQSIICSDDQTVDFTITYQTGSSGNFDLVYHTTPLTTAQLYARATATEINDAVTITASQNYTIQSSFAFPTNTSGSVITYYVYAILDAAHPDYHDPTCEPVVETTVMVEPETLTATFSSTSQTICGTNNGASENVIDLNTLITAGSTAGVWTTNAPSGLSGSTFTAIASMEGNLYTFTYTLSGIGTSNSCDDNVYQVFVEVINCPCLTNQILLCLGETYTATATTGVSDYQWYKDDVLLGSETNSTYTISSEGEYYYTALDANGCEVELTCRISVTSGNPTATLSSNTVSICNVDLGSSDNVFDLSSLVILGDMGGTWSEPSASGFLSGTTFTATNAALPGSPFTVNYTVAGTSPCVDVVYPVTITVNNCSCPTLSSVVTPSTICQADVFSVTANHSSAPGDLSIYYNSGAVLTANDLYSVGNGGAALLTSISSPAGTSSSSHGNALSAGTYNIYLVLGASNPENNPPTCQPMATSTITVQNLTETVTIDDAPTICNVDLGANDNQLDLNSLISSGPTTGTWNDDDGTGGLSGSVFTAPLPVGTFNFTYTVAGPAGAGSGACNNQTYTISVDVQDCTCPILTLSGAPAQVCSNDNFNIDFNHSTNPGNIALYYYLDDGVGLTASQLYAFATATAINPNITPTGTTTTLSISLPQNTSGSNVSYLIYGILASGNGNIVDPTCQPIALTSILVKPETPTATLTTTANICEADFGSSENVINLNTLITAGDLTGAWNDDDGSGGLIGSFFTATALMGGNDYDFTYTISGTDGAGIGNCNDQTYTVTITVDICTVPCPDLTGITAPDIVCTDNNFDITINFESGIGNLGLFYGDDISLTPQEFYTDNSALTVINADFTTSGTSNMQSISLAANTDTISKKIYLYVALSSTNLSINDPFCLPFSTYILRQEPATTITVTPTDPTTCSGTDGSILIQTVAADSTYAVSYTDDGTPIGPTNMTANSNGLITLSGLNAGSYTNIFVSRDGCAGATVATTLSDPTAPSVSPSAATVCNTTNIDVDGSPSGGSGTFSTHAWTDLGTGSAVGHTLTNTSTQTINIDATTATTVGTVDLQYTVTDNNGCSGTGTVTITIEDQPEAGNQASALTICETSTTTITLANELTGEDAGGTWTAGGSNPIGGTLTAVGGTFDPTGSSVGTYTFTYSFAAGTACIADNATVTIIVEDQPEAGNQASALTICETSTTTITLANELTGEDAGGTWTAGGSNPSGGTFTAVGGTFDPTGSSVGTYTFTYSFTAGTACIADNATVTINVVTQPEAGNQASALTICETSMTTITLADELAGEDTGGTWTAGGSNPSGGTFTAIGGTFDPTGASVGTYTFTYSFAAVNGCAADNATVTIIVENQPEAGNQASALTICETSTTTITLADELTGEDTGGTWTAGGPNPSGGTFTAIGGTFDPTGASVGTYTFTYSFAAGTACIADNATVTIIVENQPEAGNQASALTICETSTTTITLADELIGEDTGGTWTAGGSNPSGGTFTAIGGTFDPTGTSVGTYTFTYSFAAGTACIADNATVTIIVENQPEAGNQASALTICETSTTTITLANQLTGEDAGGTWTAGGSNPIGGTFTAVGGTFDPTGSSVGTYTFTYSFAAGTACIADNATVTIIVEDQPEAGNQASALTICETSTTTITLANELTGEDAGGTWTAGGSNPSGGTFTAVGGTFDPTGASVGTYTFTYSFAAGTACIADNATVTIIVEDQPEAGNQASALTICETSTTTITLANELTGEDAGGTWTAGGSNPIGGTFTAVGGTFDPTGASVGTYTFTYSFAAGTACIADNAIVTIIVEDQPEAGNQATALIICETSTTTITLADELTGEDAGGTWTAGGSNPSGGTFTAVGGTFDPTGSSVGTYTFTYSFAAGTACIADNAIVTINVGTQPEAGNQASALTICETSTTTITLADELAGEDAGGTWTAGGSNPSGGTFTAVGGTFDPTGASVGTYTFTYSFASINGCAADNATVTIIVENQPEAGNQASALTICETSTTTITLANELTGEDAGGTWTAGGSNPSGGTFTAVSGTFDPTGASVGTYTFTYSFAAGTACIADNATVTIIVEDQPEAGNQVSALTICETSTTTITLADELSGEDAGGTWTAGGSNPSGGTFTAVGGTFDPTGSSVGTYTFTYSFAAGAACIADNATVTIIVEDQPEAGNQASALTICETSTTTITLANELTGEDAGGTWTAGGSNPSGGTFTAVGGTFDPTGASVGTYTFTYSFAAGTACIADNATVTIIVATNPTCLISGTTSVTESTTGHVFTAPVGMSNYAWSISGDGSIVGASNAQTVTVDAGGVGSFTLTVNITDGNGCSTSCMHSVTVISALMIDLSLEKTVDNSVADVGSTVTFTLIVHNAGPDTGTGIQVTDQLPTGFSFLGDDGGGDYVANIWTVNDLAIGESDTLEIMAQVLATGSYTNQAEITAANEADVDSDPGTDATTDDLTDGLPDDDEDEVTLTPSLDFDLSLDKHLATGQNSTVDIGDDVSYTIVITNEGDVSASNIQICDLLPKGLILSPLDGNGWTGTAADTLYHTIAGPILPGNADSVDIILRVVYGGSGASLINTAEIFSDEDSDGNGVIDTDSEPANGNLTEDDIEDEQIVLLEHDPTGYIYCEKTGKLITGGTISVTGPSGIPDDPAEIFIAQNGSSGYYEWFAVGPIGTYSMSYSHPNGHTFSSTKTVTAPLYSVPTAPPNITLGSDTTGMYLTDTTFANNPYYLNFEIEPGDAFIFFNNLPVSCVFISAIVCEDDDLNDLDDGNEPAFANVIVRLYDCSDTINAIDTTLTDANGRYIFDGLAAGSYRIQFVNPAGYRVISAQDTVSADGFVSCSVLALGECDTTKTVCFRTIPYDWGDLPDGSASTQAGDYQTTSANSGPSHEIITGLVLGASVDEETDGQQSTAADGDGGDEDGITFPVTLNINRNITISRPFTVTNATGVTAHLEAWIDWNGDGDFDDTNEMIANLSDDGAGDFGISVISFTVPSDAIQNQAIGVRLRLSQTDNMTPYGQINSGEVEDYLISIGCPLEQCLPIQVTAN